MTEDRRRRTEGGKQGTESKVGGESERIAEKAGAKSQ